MGTPWLRLPAFNALRMMGNNIRSPNQDEKPIIMQEDFV